MIFAKKVQSKNKKWAVQSANYNNEKKLLGCVLGGGAHIASPH
jgi:hypothetical protein